MSLKKIAIKAFGWSLADKLVNQVGYLAVTVFIARLIGPESFGLIGMLTIFILLAESVVSNGFSQALVQKSNDATEEDASTIFYINFVWGMFIYVALYFTAPWIAEFYKQPELVDISRVLFLIVVINSLAVVARAKLIIKIDFKSQAIVNTLATLLASLLAVYMALEGYDYWAFVALLIAKSVFSSMGLWLFCRWLPKLVFSGESFRQLFKFGSNLMLAGMVATFVNNLYVALIGRYFSATAVGYYTQATNLSNYIYQFISSTLQGVTYPIMTSVKDDKERLVGIYRQLISVTMIVSLPLLIGLAAVADNVVLLFLGKEWLPAVPLLVALCIARAVTPISAINMNILNAIGRSDLFLKVDLSKIPLSLAALFIALPYGVEAVAWAVTVTSLISFFINAYMPGKLFGVGGLVQLKMAWKYIVAVLVMYVAVKQINFDSIYLTLFAQVSLGGVSYLCVVAILKDKFFYTQARVLAERFK